MNEIVTRGMICLDDEFDFVYCVADIYYTEYENESYRYEIVPNYSVIRLLKGKDFHGISGVDLSLKKESYVWENKTPIFIRERTPGKERKDLLQFMEVCDLVRFNRLNWMSRTKMRHSGDGLYVCKMERPEMSVYSIGELGDRALTISHRALEIICAGGKLRAKGFGINDRNRKAYYDLFMAMYKKEKEYLGERRKGAAEKSEGWSNHWGRTRINISKQELYHVFAEYKIKKITAQEAAKKLQVSEATFYRRYREYIENID